MIPKIQNFQNFQKTGTYVIHLLAVSGGGGGGGVLTAVSGGASVVSGLTWSEGQTQTALGRPVRTGNRRRFHRGRVHISLISGVTKRSYLKSCQDRLCLGYQ